MMEDCSNNSDSYTASTTQQDESAPLGKRRKISVLFWSRFAIVALLSIATAALGFAAYKLASRDEQDDFLVQFNSVATSVIDSSQTRMAHLLADLKTLSTTTTSFAKHENATWPFVTLPDFEERAKSFRESTLASTIVFLPLVSDSDRPQWREYAQANQGWLKESYDSSSQVQRIPSDIWSYTADSEENGMDCEGERLRMQAAHKTEPSNSGPYAPLWQISPPLPANSTSSINYNLLDKRSVAKTVSAELYSREPSLVNVCHRSSWFGNEPSTTSPSALQAAILAPVFDGFEEDANIVGYFLALLDVTSLFASSARTSSDQVAVILQSTCGESYHYTVQGPAVDQENAGDLRESVWDSVEVAAPFMATMNDSNAPHAKACQYSVVVHPTVVNFAAYQTHSPALYTLAVVLVFLLIFALFVVYDFVIQRRQLSAVKAVAMKHEGLVSSLFPENVRKKVLSQATDGLSSGKTDSSDAPIADLYLNCTVLFADLAGFTAWSSTREPAQVFTLLETIYHEFDEIAKQRGVFKIETIGDCYVATTGIPKPQANHALIMARFARDCVSKMHVLVHQLETQLGPDTADLRLRVGIHSGAVTAGVLRGDKARFQLFGDTVNTASRIESSGLPNRIQLSEETANLIIAAGKHHWVEPREELVHAKGKGELRTFWLVMHKDSDTQSTTSSDKVESSKTVEGVVDDEDLRLSLNRSRTERLVEWNCDVLLRLLKQVIARRHILQKRDPMRKADADESCYVAADAQVIDEVMEIIEVPNHRVGDLDYESIVLPKEVVDEMYDYVTNIAAMYHDNPFHNFEHASHVAMSVTKLLSRIVAPAESECGAKSLHDHTYGITSDPLTQFACVFSALIHDVDHRGVPNCQLVNEKTPLAEFYKGKSVAEQNSIDLAWGLLMDSRYANLRRSIYTTKKGLERFRQMVVNSVMATDIFDKDLKMLRDARWAKAFSGNVSETSEDARNRKATIIIEHLIQASDVAHTMQHWHVYRKWNQRFFFESYQAYLDGRSQTDPSVNWYKGEMGFFDFYIIPLAKKLKDCGVFGKSSDEYLNYAETNRKEWELKGEEVVAEMVRMVKS